MAKISNVEIPSLLFDDQAGDPSTPAAGFSRIYTKSDGAYVIDDAGTVTGPFVESTGAGGGLVAYDIETYTAGDVALTSTSVAALTGPGDLVVAATAGDVLAIDVSARTENTTVASIGLDVATIVSAAPVNYMSSRNGTPKTTGRPAWFLASSTNGAAGGVCHYVVQAGDISGGNVTLRLYYRVSGNRTIAANSNVPLEFSCVNLGQP